MLIEEVEDLIEWNLSFGVSKKETLISLWKNDFYELLEGEDMRIALLRRYPELLIDKIKLINVKN